MKKVISKICTSHTQLSPGDIVHIVGVPATVNDKANPVYMRLGVVRNSQPGDVDVVIDGFTDQYGIGFMPESLAKVDPIQLLISCQQADTGLNGIEILRNAVKWFDYRPEVHNEDKTPQHLLNEYAAALVFGMGIIK